MAEAVDGRIFAPELTALARRRGDHIDVASPVVGLWRRAPEVGTVVIPGGRIGEIEVLGVVHLVRAPADVRGRVVELCGERRGRRPVGYGEPLFVLDPRALGEIGAVDAAAAEETADGALLFRSPSSGRYYGRPAPEKPPFVEAGAEVAAGQTICLLEIMKTFNRVVYEGDGLPPRARVVRIVPADEEDLGAGDPILELEPVD